MYNTDQTSNPSPAPMKEAELAIMSQQMDRFLSNIRQNDTQAPTTDDPNNHSQPRSGQAQMAPDLASNYNQLFLANSAGMFQGLPSSAQGGYPYHGGGMYFPSAQNRAMYGLNNHNDMNAAMFSGLQNNPSMGMGMNPMMFQGPNQVQPQDFPEASSSAIAHGRSKPERADDLNTGSVASASTSASASKPSAGEKVIKRRRKKPRNSPRRPLSAYNLFFKDERKRILEEIPDDKDKKKDDAAEITWPGKKKTPHGKIGFENLAKTIGRRWKEISPEQLEYYKKLAVKDLQRYANEMTEYEKRMNRRVQDSDESEDEDGGYNSDTPSSSNKRKKRMY